jgi:hypothetical protein
LTLPAPAPVCQLREDLPFAPSSRQNRDCNTPPPFVLRVDMRITDNLRHLVCFTLASPLHTACHVAMYACSPSGARNNIESATQAELVMGRDGIEGVRFRKSMENGCRVGMDALVHLMGTGFSVCARRRPYPLCRALCPMGMICMGFGSEGCVLMINRCRLVIVFGRNPCTEIDSSPQTLGCAFGVWPIARPVRVRVCSQKPPPCNL